MTVKGFFPVNHVRTYAQHFAHFSYLESLMGERWQYWKVCYLFHILGDGRKDFEKWITRSNRECLRCMSCCCCCCCGMNSSSRKKSGCWNKRQLTSRQAGQEGMMTAMSAILARFENGFINEGVSFETSPPSFLSSFLTSGLMLCCCRLRSSGSFKEFNRTLRT